MYPFVMLGRHSQRSVLIVEDEAVLALDLSQRLESLGFQVTGVVGHSSDVLDAVRAQRPNVVLMDVGLPGDVDGVTLAEEIIVCEDTPVVFLSAHSDTSVVQRAARCGAYGYLAKPVSYPALSASLDMAIEKHGDLRLWRGDARQLQRAFDALGFAVVGLDDQGAVMTMNREAIELTGWMLIEARSTVPPWASRLNELPAKTADCSPVSLTIETRDAARVRIMVQKLRLKRGGSVCVMFPTSSPSTVQA